MRFSFFIAASLALAPCALASLQNTPSGTPLVIPAYSGFVEPDAEGAEVSEEGGIRQWKDGKQKIAWFGDFKEKGELRVTLLLKLPQGEKSRLKVSIEKRSRIAEAVGVAGSSVRVDFGEFSLSRTGYQRIQLEGVQKTGATFGDLESLILDGDAARSAHFSRVERRNAASVHLGYPIEPSAKITWFYNEITVRTEPLWSYYMACGFRRGYFGIQVNSPTERRIIFSVWDSGNEAVDRNKVAEENRVKLLAKGDSVFADSFGNEGTGGHSHLVYSWKKDTPYRFLVSARPQGDKTIYSGYFFFPETQKWGLIARFRAPKDGDYLRGLYSFNENFSGSNGQMRRYAEFGPAWVRTSEGKWRPLNKARFTHDSHGRAERKDYDAGVIHGRYYLSNGGFLRGKTQYGDTIDLKQQGAPPSDAELPAE